MKETKRITATYQNTIVEWLKEIQRKEGFTFSQTVNWVLKKAKEAEDNGSANH